MHLLLTGRISPCRIFPVHATIIILTEELESGTVFDDMTMNKTCGTDARPLAHGLAVSLLPLREDVVEPSISPCSLRNEC